MLWSDDVIRANLAFVKTLEARMSEARLLFAAGPTDSKIVVATEKLISAIMKDYSGQQLGFLYYARAALRVELKDTSGAVADQEKAAELGYKPQPPASKP